MKLDWFSWALIFFSALCDSYAAFVVKAKFNELGPMDFTSFSHFARYVSAFVRNPLLLTAVVAFVVAPGLWFLALNRMELSVGYPALVGFHLLFVLIFGLVFLGEVLTVYKLAGIGFALLSLYFLFASTGAR